MKFVGATFVISSLLVASASGAPASLVRRGVDPNLVPQFGLQAGINPTGTGDCDGIKNAAGQVVKIPCFCPPDRGSFIASLSANAAAGQVVNNPSVKVSFPTDNSKASQLARIQTAIVTLQNLRGPGVGCPAASTTFLAQQRAIAAGPDTGSPVPAPTPASPAPTPESPAPTPTPGPAGSVDPNLVPQFGLQAGLNPTGTGDCDGIKNAAGQVVKISCSCPPDRDSFIASLSANVAAGHAINNPGVAVSFPTDNSKASKLARIQAAIVTLQNLRGPGVGCPAASTTFVAQQQVIAAGS